MENKHISNTTEASSEGILNSCLETNVSHAKTNTDFIEKTFDSLVNKIITNNDSLSLDESSDSEDSANISCKSIDNKNKKQQDEMCEASKSYENDVNVSESNLGELTDTKLVDGKLVSVHTSSPSTALSIMKILSRKSGPHTCLECCVRCKNAFRLLDTPLHICRIRSIEKQNEILKIEPLLYADSCLCDFCWMALENTYRNNKLKNKKEESYSEKKERLLERYLKYVPKKKNQARICSIHLCSLSHSHKMTVNEFENIEELFLTFESCGLVFVQSTKQTTDFLKFPFCLCKIHHSMIMVMSKCQICGDKLNAPFNTDDWLMHKMWNCVLIENKLPLVLKPGMFICATCKGHVSKKNPGFPPTIDLSLLRGYINMTYNIRLQLYGESQNNLFRVSQGSTDAASPIVVSKIKGQKKCVRSTKVKFSDPLITSIYNFEIGYSKNGTESNKIVDPVSIKKKRSNVICGTVSNKDVKKQRLNEKHSSNKNNSTDDNTTKSYKNISIAHPK